MVAVVLVGSALLGACLGSFANVCVWRLPRPGLSPGKPVRSLCPRCGFLIPWHDNIPVLSWLFLGGACRRCGGTIGVRYTVVEILTAVAVALLGWRFLCHDFAPAQFAAATILALGLVVAAFIDLELMLLPDEVMLPALGLAPWFFFVWPGQVGPGEDFLGRLLASRVPETFGGGLALGPEGALICAAATGALGGVLLGEAIRRAGPPAAQPTTTLEPAAAPLLTVAPFYALGAAAGAAAGRLLADPAVAAAPGMTALVSSLAGAACGAGGIGLIRVLGRYAFAQEAMGFGDVKLMGLLGALTGPSGTLWTLVLASVSGSVVGVLRFAVTRQRQLPFGPFLIAGAVVTVFGRRSLASALAWYGELVAGAR